MEFFKESDFPKVVDALKEATKLPVENVVRVDSVESGIFKHESMVHIPCERIEDYVTTIKKNK